MTVSENPEHQLGQIGHYDLERVLGRGAMGVVYLARDRRIGRRVALKTITVKQEQLDDSTSPKEFHTRLQREAEVSGSLQHPNIVTLYEAGYEDERITYLAMEYVEGETLLSLMKACSPAPIELDATLAIIDDVLRGLAYAHAAGIIHRDVKPANILVTNEGPAKIADFGIARPKNSSITAAGALVGTPNYMSPEQVLGQTLTPKADVFSTGVMLFEMLTGLKPFVAPDLTGILHNVLRQKVPHVSDMNPAVPRSVGDVVEQMMAKAPEDRPSAADALAQLEAIRRTAVERGRASSSFRIGPYVIAAGIALLIIASIVTAISLTHRAARPTVQISPAQIREFDEKRRALELADTALLAGRYQESIDRYNAYLAKYPASEAAIKGRDQARQALERQSAPGPKAASTKAKQKKRPRDEDISPSDLLNRIKKVFRSH